jgi:hypothetical protein
MSDTQRQALEAMADRSIGALLVFGLGWVWPEHVRQNEAIAERVLDVLRNEEA